MQRMLSITILLLIFQSVHAQTVKYFEFTTICGHGNWQDTSFIAATSDQVVIDSVYANLARPLSQRNFISGNIDYGNGGHNHNASHWFLWHFVPSQWNLAEMAIEVCDGCPFTDLDSDTAYWVENIGQYCPWSGMPVREVSGPLDLPYDPFDSEIQVFPNPATDKVTLSWNGDANLHVHVLNAIGKIIIAKDVSAQNPAINLTGVSSGVYFIYLTNENKTAVKKLVIEKV